jgi:hypothetical protein
MLPHVLGRIDTKRILANSIVNFAPEVITFPPPRSGGGDQARWPGPRMRGQRFEPISSLTLAALPTRSRR